MKVYDAFTKRSALLVLLAALIAASSVPAFAGPHHPRRHTRPPARIVQLPHHFTQAKFHGTRYYYHNGVCYRHGPRGFYVVRAPIGFRVPSLPFGTMMVRVNAIPYYYYYGAYYTYDSGANVYIVTEKPGDQSIQTGSTSAESSAKLPNPEFDQLVLVDGTTIEGTFLGSTADMVEFEAAGDTLHVELSKVVAINLAPPSEDQ